MRVHLREDFNIVVYGVVRRSGGKDQSKMQTHMHIKMGLSVTGADPGFGQGGGPVNFFWKLPMACSVGEQGERA